MKARRRNLRASTAWIVGLALILEAFPAGGPAGAKAMAARPSTGTDWTQFRFDPAGTGFNPYETILSPETVGGLKVAWTVSTPGYVNSSPAVVDGVLYIGAGPEPLTASSFVYAIDAATGTVLWSRKHPYSLLPTDPTVAHGMVYVGTLGDDTLRAYNARTGAIRWTFGGAGAPADPVVVGDVLYLSVNTGYVYALDARTGQVLWTSPHVGPISPNAVAVAGTMVYAGSDDRHLYAFDRRDGHIVWSAPTRGGMPSSPAVSHGRVFVGSADRHLYAFDAATGHQLWKRPTGDDVYSSPTTAYGRVFVASTDGVLHAFDQALGTPRWTVPTGGKVTLPSPVVANGVVYIGSQDDSMYAVDAMTGQILWSYATGAVPGASAAVADGVLYFGSDDQTIYAFSLG